jgi:hypothetical protein
LSTSLQQAALDGEEPVGRPSAPNDIEFSGEKEEAPSTDAESGCNALLGGAPLASVKGLDQPLASIRNVSASAGIPSQ